MSDRVCIGCGEPYGKGHLPTCVRFTPPTYNQAQLDEAVRKVEQERKTLATAIVNTARNLGVCQGETDLTGPQVLLLLNDIEALAQKTEKEAELEDKVKSLNSDLVELGKLYALQVAKVESLEAFVQKYEDEKK